MERFRGLGKIGKFRSLIQEVAYGVFNSPRSFEQKRRVNIDEAQEYLLNLKDAVSEQNTYFTPGEKPLISRYLDSGFHNACYEFNSNKGINRWVIKIGHEKAPMRTQFNPSTKEYKEFYENNLEIQRNIFGNELPYLIPEPQGVFYIQGKNRATTVIIQPFIDYISTFDSKIQLNQEEQQQLGNESDKYQTLKEYMRKNYGLMPDFTRAFGKNGHLVIVRKTDGVHLVMLDNGVFDEKRDRTPGLHIVNNVIANNSFKIQLKRFGK